MADNELEHCGQEFYPETINKIQLRNQKISNRKLSSSSMLKRSLRKNVTSTNATTGSVKKRTRKHADRSKSPLVCKSVFDGMLPKATTSSSTSSKHTKPKDTQWHPGAYILQNMSGSYCEQRMYPVTAYPNIQHHEAASGEFYLETTIWPAKYVRDGGGCGVGYKDRDPNVLSKTQFICDRGHPILKQLIDYHKVVQQTLIDDGADDWKLPN